MDTQMCMESHPDSGKTALKDADLGGVAVVMARMSTGRSERTVAAARRSKQFVIDQLFDSTQAAPVPVLVWATIPSLT